MTLALPTASTISEIQHNPVCAGFDGDAAATALRNDQPFHQNHKKTQEGNKR
jgi:hypothetical protein